MIVPICQLISGVVLFLFALTFVSDALMVFTNSKVQRWIEAGSRTLPRALVAGILITIILDSSSAVIIITLALVNAGVLPLRQAVGIILGANIGTTLSSQIIALDIGELSVIPLSLGFMAMHAQSQYWRTMGKVSFGFGLLFFGLYTIEQSVIPFRESAVALEALSSLDSPFLGAFVGALVTVVVQSSSATVGIAISLCSEGVLSPEAGLAVMLGAELGTCSDTLIASIGRSRGTLVLGLFHLLFNFFTIVLCLVVFDPFVTAVKLVSSTANPQFLVANGHMLFNIIGVLLVLPLVRFMVPMLEDWAKNGDRQYDRINDFVFLDQLSPAAYHFSSND